MSNNNTNNSEEAFGAAAAKSPLAAIKKLWIHAKKDEKKKFFNDGILALKIEAFLNSMLFYRVGCDDVLNPKRGPICHCMNDLSMELSDDESRSCVQWLLDYCTTKSDATLQKERVIVWIQYAQAATQDNVTSKSKVFLLPGTSHLVCRNAIATILGLGKDAWKTLVDHSRNHTAPTHGLIGMGVSNEATAALLKSFFDIIKELGTPRATKVVRDVVVREGKAFVRTEMREVDEDIVELPTNISKRSLYHRLLKEHGYAMKFGAGGSITEKLHPLDGSIDLTTMATKQSDLPSWASFLGFWEKNYPKLVVARAREDICGECYIYANSHKFKTSTTSNEIAGSNEANNNNHDANVNEMLEGERLVLKAAKHVEMARVQRELFIRKKNEALFDTKALVSRKHRRFCFVADYSQNAYIPNFQEEQPGKTYYYSPMNVYIFGIVNAGVQPYKLTAPLYFEGEAKKGGNNVVSMLLKNLYDEGVMETFETRGGGPVKELNFIFDNCSGQNKNRMVLRFMLWLVQMNVCLTARAIFLIRGHTKNDCDRMFNLMKQQYRKSNSYTPDDCITLLNKHDDVNAYHFKTEWFGDWDTYLDKFVRKPTQVKMNHIFTCYHTDKDAIYTQEYDTAPAKRQLLVKEDHRGKDWMNTCCPQRILPTGLSDIKWLELYNNWRPLIPEVKWDEFKYYKEDPGPKRRRTVKDQSKQLKKQRKDRSHTEFESTKSADQNKQTS